MKKKIKDMVMDGMFYNNGQIPKPFHSILLYSNGVQYEHSNGIAIGEHDGICFQAYGKNVKAPDYWQYIDCD